MILTNKEIIIILIILIIIVFISSYDVYVVNKGENVCKPVKLIKRPIPLVPPLNKQERDVKRETFKNLTADGYFLKFKDMPPQTVNLPILSDYKLPSKISYEKAGVISSVIRVLSTVPTDLTNEDVKTLLNFYVTKYVKAETSGEFISAVTSADESGERSNPTEGGNPYNTRYSKLIMFLIVQFNEIMMNKNANLIGYNPKTQIPLYSNPNANIAQTPPQPSADYMRQVANSNVQPNNNDDLMQAPSHFPQTLQRDEIESFNSMSFDDYQPF
jgi:hypothetical protein